MEFIYRVHALERMFERELSEEAVEYAIKNGVIIEEYLNDKPYPSYLVSCVFDGKNLHVVYAKSKNSIIIITVYEPSLKKWEKDFKTRKK